MAPPAESKDDEEIEEDWSEFMTSDLSGGFAQHEHQEILLANGKMIQISSVSSLSPLDMVNLSWGTHDTTGHLVWMGARFFLEALPKLETHFANRRVLELGSGTGLSGLAVSKFYETKQIVMTDSSKSSLELCRENCTSNHVNGNVTVEELSWGAQLSPEVVFDTVLATDVLYDIQLWEPLLQTAIKSLRGGGAFVLSHVPRAAMPERAVGESCITLEEILIARAEAQNFRLTSRVSPRDISGGFNGWEEMEQIGAAIFTFQKKTLFHDSNLNRG